MVRGAGRDGEVHPAREDRLHLDLQRTLAEVEADPGPVGTFRVAVRMVVLVDHQQLPGGHPAPGAVREHGRRGPGRPDREDVHVDGAGFPTLPVTDLSLLAARRTRPAESAPEDDLVVIHGAVAGLELHGPHPATLRDVQPHELCGNQVRPVRRHGYGRQFDHVVRLAHLPAIPEPRRLGHQRRIARLGAAIDPGDDRLDLLLAQPGVVRPLAVLGIREPRRHLTVDDDAPDRACPRPRLPVSQEGHRRDLARSMAADTVAHQDRRHVAAEDHRVGVGGGGGDGERGRGEGRDQGDRRFPGGPAAKRNAVKRAHHESPIQAHGRLLDTPLAKRATTPVEAARVAFAKEPAVPKTSGDPATMYRQTAAAFSSSACASR